MSKVNKKEEKKNKMEMREMEKKEKNMSNGVMEIKRKIDKKEIDISELDKENRVFLFLIDSSFRVDNKEIEKLYLEKYNLSEKSNKVNWRVIERFIGEYYKWSSEKKENRVKVLKEELKKLNIDYSKFIGEVKEIKKRVNSRNNILGGELKLKI